MQVRLVPPHSTKSRIVLDKDIERVLTDAPVMRAICTVPHGIYREGFAVAHSQVEENDPLRFFVLKDGTVIINPVITRHSSSFYVKKEGCLSFPKNILTTTSRWYKCEVAFYTYTVDKTLSERHTRSVKGLEAQIWQHEIDHMNGIYIYDPTTIEDSSSRLPEGYPG